MFLALVSSTTLLPALVYVNVPLPENVSIMRAQRDEQSSRDSSLINCPKTYPILSFDC